MHVGAAAAGWSRSAEERPYPKVAKLIMKRFTRADWRWVTQPLGDGKLIRSGNFDRTSDDENVSLQHGRGLRGAASNRRNRTKRRQNV